MERLTGEPCLKGGWLSGFRVWERGEEEERDRKRRGKVFVVFGCRGQGSGVYGLGLRLKGLRFGLLKRV